MRAPNATAEFGYPGIDTYLGHGAQEFADDGLLITPGEELAASD